MCNRNCFCLIAAAISLVVGIVAGLVFFNALITGITAVIIVALILAAISAISLLLVNGRREEQCLCDNGICLVTGILGTFVTGVIALALTLTTGTIGFAILIGLVGFFLALTLISLVSLLYCIVNANCSCKECR